MQKSIHSSRYKAFLRLLREARREAGVTQEQLAARLKETQSFISKCERGERRLDLVEVWTFCEALRVPFPRFTAKLDRELRTRK